MKVIIVGGFLGAGKTTMLWNAAKRLTEQGHKVGLITNDQASELVDTKFLEISGGRTAEVSGSCFCCNFPGFVSAIESFEPQGIDVILAEPVGSCTDLSATIVQPIKDQFAGRISLTPMSVLADAQRLRNILDGGNAGLHKSAAYIVRKQLEEADMIVINKTDLLDAAATEALKTDAQKAFPGAKVFAASAQEGTGVDAWLAVAMTSETAGTHLLKDIDYDIYAEGEAVLGWLNATISLKAKDQNWKDFVQELLGRLGQRFDQNRQAVGHVKALITGDNGIVIGNLTGESETLKVRGEPNFDSAVTLTLNARVEMAPEELQRAVEEELKNTADGKVAVKIDVLRCLQPGRPNPTYRYDRVV